MKDDEDREPIPTSNPEAAEYLNGVSWEGAHQDTETWVQDQHASAIANAPEQKPDGLFRR